MRPIVDKGMRNYSIALFIGGWSLQVWKSLESINRDFPLLRFRKKRNKNRVDTFVKGGFLLATSEYLFVGAAFIISILFYRIWLLFATFYRLSLDRYSGER